ncbi:FtsX-like permease family protein [Streptomyces bambusae]|uniref:FtsX-like permease family protein n=1 Tax=Streptomyces bambusae TaxID=1550616 RepID=A0ABS6ZCY3_9ACTN|nr:FtsX-like permease family protein [Streptomyces bambusae]MBW5484596.1 FtsX-like permease family protein [Streptomyces bambusae]
MKSWYHSWVAALRIARRDAWRAKGRSALVLAMIALPIAGVSAADLTARSAELSAEQQAQRKLGAADAQVENAGLGGPILQHPKGVGWAPAADDKDLRLPPSRGNTRDATAGALKAVLPADAELVQESKAHIRVRTPYGLLEVQARELDTAQPMVRGLFTLDRGQLPERHGELIATEAFLEESGLHVGSSVTPRGSTTPYTIVGAYEKPDELRTSELLAPPGTLLAPLDQALQAAGMRGVAVEDSWFVTVGGREGFTWNMVQQANAKGLVVVSKAVLLNPPPNSEVPLFRKQGGSGSEVFPSRATELAALVTVVGLAMLEICLLAGPAFAVGARRSRRQLGLVGANGGDRRHIRAIVLSGGIVIGAAAAVVGIALGLTLTLALQPVLEQQLGTRFGDFDVRPLELLGIAALAVLTGLLAAVAPAVTASRQTVLASLTGRRGVRRAGRVLPVLGLVAIGLGGAIALFGSVSELGVVVVAGGSALAELGIVALTPVLVGLFGRAGRWLPLAPRLALRDAVRNRGRTAPAVAAVLAAVAGTVAVATYDQSREAEERHRYVSQLPDGTGKLVLNEEGGWREVPAVREALSRDLPVAVRADLERIVVGKPDCNQYSIEAGCGLVEVLVPKDRQCPLSGPQAQEIGRDQARALAKDWRCAESSRYVEYSTVVADETLLKALAVTDPGTVQALKAGQAVSFDPRPVKDGKVTLRLVTDSEKAREAEERGEDPPGQDKVFAVHQAPAGAEAYGFRLVLPPAATKAAGLTTVAYGSYFTLDGKASSEQRQRLNGELDWMGVDAALYVEEGFQGGEGMFLLVLSVFAGLVTVGAAGIATGLAQADAEADLKTLSAVGAAPRLRRTLSGFQCGVVAAMGVVLGSAAGLLPGIGLRLAERREQARMYREASFFGFRDTATPYVPVVVPWETLAVLIVAVPLGAALLAALVTRSGGAVARRAAG